MAWWRPRRLDDFDEEVRAHLEAEEARLCDRGVAPDEARRRALAAFGGTMQARERFRERRPWHRVDTLWQDARYGARLMRRSPAFTITAVVVLALGIGANATLFSVLNGLFFRDLHVRQPDQLVYLQTRAPLGRVMPQVDRDDAAVLREAAKDIADFTGHLNITWTVSVDDETSTLNGEVVEPNYFDLLGVTLERGRGFRLEDNEPSNPELSVIVSHDFWTKQLAGDPAAIGRSVHISGRTLHIIGITPEGFHGLASPFRPSAWWLLHGQVAGGRMDLGPIARLKPGVQIAALQALVAARTPGLVRSQWDRMPHGSPSVFPWEVYRNKGYPVVRISDVDNPVTPEAPLVPTSVLAAIATVSVLVLVIACANIAGLLLARGTSRAGEIAVRQALGAAGPRLFRQVLTESLLLSGSGAVLGVGVALALVRIFTAVTPDRFMAPIAVDARVLVFAVCGAVASGLLVGLTPALQATRVQVLQALGSGVSGSRGTGRSSARWIVVPQITVSLVLLLVAAVHLHALQRIEARDPGYRTSGTTVFEIGRLLAGLDLWKAGLALRIGPADMARARTFARNLEDAVAVAPGVDRFAIASLLPLDATFRVERRVLDPGAPPQVAAPALSAVEAFVSDGYFDVMNMRVIAGRTFDARERPYGAGGLHTAVVSTSVAAPFGGADLIGRSIGLASDGGPQSEALEVIGIVNDVDPVLNDGHVHPVVYEALRQQERPALSTVLVRGHGDGASLMASVKQAVLGADASAEITRVRTLDDIADEILYPRRLAAGILAAAAMIALGLACLGLYGIVSHSSAQRTREFGIRAALGATRQNIVRLVLHDGTIVLGAGLSLGLALSVVALRAASTVVRGLPTFDTVVFLTVPLALVFVVLVACLSPALRAARVDPAQVIRGE